MLDYSRRIAFSYKGRIADENEPFEESSPGEPMEVVLGEGRIFPSLERALRQMAVGETRTVPLSCSEAYGEPSAHAIYRIPLYSMPNFENLVAGETILIDSPRADRPGRAVVRDISDGMLTLDFNHPLAGKDLVYEVTLLSVEE